jgi:hypothetical protein
MPVILSLDGSDDSWIAAGPEGLFRYTDDNFIPISQPQEKLLCTLQLDNMMFVGGVPHGVALSPDAGETWHPALIKHDGASILDMSADPEWSSSGVLLAASAGQGIFRSEDRGWRWVSCNFGLHTYTILCFGWTQPMSKQAFPRWKIVFAGGDDGIYRSPNGGLGWKRCIGDPQHTQIIVADIDFHENGIVLAGTEADGLWRSEDGGYTFDKVPNTPSCINTILQTPQGWLLSDEEHLYHSDKGIIWNPIPDSQPALVLRQHNDLILAGGADGIRQINALEQL